MLWKLASRRIISNRRRTVFLILSLALSSFALAVGASLLASFRSNIESGLRRGFAGDLQVYNAGNPPPEFTAEVPVDFLTLPDPEAAMRTLREDPDVREVAPRSSASGLILAGDSTAPAILIGIDPAQEADTLHRLLPRGTDVLGTPGGILLGRPMAERLQRAGEVAEVTVLIPTADGLFEGDRFAIEGIYSSPGLPLIDEFVAFLPLDHLQSLLGDEGYPGSLVVRLRDGADPAVVRDRLQRVLQDRGLQLEISTWEELAGDLLGMVRVGRYLIGSGFLFVLLVVVVGIGNTLLVLMLDRTREIGLMRALGTARGRIIRSLVAEVAVLSTVASAAGAMAGAGLCAVLGRVGIPATTRAMTYAFGGERFFPEVHPDILFSGFLLVALLGPLVAIAPAVYASAVDPAVTMRNPL